MGVEGRISIELGMAGPRVDRVAITSSRPVHASRVFLGKSVPQTLEMLPLLFTICATAQACAAARACEQAAGSRPAPGIERIRDCLVRMETLREHLWRISLDWPGFVGEAPEQGGMAEILALQRDHRGLLTSGHDPFLHPAAIVVGRLQHRHGLTQRVHRALARTVFDMPPTHWLRIRDREGLSQWMASGATVAARLLKLVVGSHYSGIGRCDVQALPDRGLDCLEPLFADEHFVAAPHWFGACRETSCTSRVHSPLLRELRCRDGNGLLVRLVARLTEIAQLSLALFDNDATVPVPVPVPARPANTGLGQAAAARGQLLHRVQLVDGRITDYRILAPTEWNFHPRGVVAGSLATLGGERGEVKRQAMLLINAIDPCVGYDMEVR